MNFRTALSRALRLKCPECGKANIADGWLSTTPSCSACGTDLNVETGYFLGAIYFNYGATVLIVLSAAIPLIFVAKLPTLPVVAGAVIFCTVFPLWFFRYARSLWLAMDHYYHVRRRDAAELSTLSGSNTFVSKPDDNSQIGCICPLCHDRFTVAAEHSNKWGKCPNCYGDVLLLRAFNVEHDSKSTNSQAAATQSQLQFSP